MSTAIASRANSNGNGTLTGFSAILESRKESIKAVLPKHMTPERVIKLASMALTKTPKLQECTPLSLYTAVLKAAELGLDCSGTLGSAYLVPFKRKFKDSGGRWQEEYECTLIVGYRGLIDLARRSNQIQSIEARVVYMNDEFSCDFGTEGKLIHRPQFDADPGEFRLVYGVAHLMGGGVQTEVMTRTAVDKIRNSSKGYYAANPSGPWHDHYEEMARKTVIRRLCKYLPMSVELESALSADDEDVVTAHVPLATQKIDPNAALALETGGNAGRDDDQTTDFIEQDTHSQAASGGTSQPVGESAPADGSPTKEEKEAAEAAELREIVSGDWATADKFLAEQAKQRGISRSGYLDARIHFLHATNPKITTPDQRMGFYGMIVGNKFDKDGKAK
jgi:recombination protein RecT